MLITIQDPIRLIPKDIAARLLSQADGAPFNPRRSPSTSSPIVRSLPAGLLGGGPGDRRGLAPAGGGPCDCLCLRFVGIDCDLTAQGDYAPCHGTGRRKPFSGRPGRAIQRRGSIGSLHRLESSRVTEASGAPPRGMRHVWLDGMWVVMQNSHVQVQLLHLNGDAGYGIPPSSCRPPEFGAPEEELRRVVDPLRDHDRRTRRTIRRAEPCYLEIRPDELFAHGERQ